VNIQSTSCGFPGNSFANCEYDDGGDEEEEDVVVVIVESKLLGKS